MTTGTDIFEKSIVIMDELSDSGTIDPNQTKEYRHKAPFLIDMGQKELARKGNLHNAEEYVASESDLNKWTKHALPVMTEMEDIVFVDADSQLKTISYRKFGNSDIYIYFKELGTVRLLYIPIPVTITDLSQTLEIDDITAVSLAYYLAEQFAMSDQNTELAQMCRSKFKELKKESMIKTPLSPTEVVDVYGF